MGSRPFANPAKAAWETEAAPVTLPGGDLILLGALGVLAGVGVAGGGGVDAGFRYRSMLM